MLSQVWKFTPQRLLTLVKESRVKKLIQNSRKSTQLAFPFTDDTVANYILQMNRSKNVSGAVAFSKLLTPTGWKLPLAPLIPSIRNRFPVSILYGSNDWIDATWAVENSKKAFGDETKVYIVPGCGHHLYAEGAEFVDEIISNGKSTKLKEVTSIEQLEKLKSASRLKIS